MSIGFFYTGHFIQRIAREAALASDKETNKSLVAIIFAACWVEAHSAELIHQAEWYRHGSKAPENGWQTLGKLSRTTNLLGHRTSILKRVGLMIECLTGSPADFGSLPLQDYSLLVSIRNFIVHQKPEPAEFPSPNIPLISDIGDPSVLRKPKSVKNRLINRGVIHRSNIDDICSLFDSIQDANVARWAYDTALDTLRLIEQQVFAEVPHISLLTIVEDEKHLGWINARSA